MNVAVIGGGINGVMSAWALALRGHSVDLFERDRLMGATSSASTKLLHGGLRYLEQGHIRLVTEALHERRWWMMRAPHLVKRLRVMLPVYEKKGRPQWILRGGLSLYEWLAGNASLGKWKWHSRNEMVCPCDGLQMEGLHGAPARARRAKPGPFRQMLASRSTENGITLTASSTPPAPGLAICWT